jgi:hypothetical protein
VIAVRLIKRSIVGVIAGAMLAAVVGAGPAYAETLTPWWGLTSGSLPANIRAGSARDEVEQLTVSATAGEFILLEPAAIGRGEFFNKNGEPEYAFFSFEATASVVQEGLEKIYGAGNLRVSGGPGDENGTKPYTIAFTSKLGGQKLAPTLAFKGSLNCEGATGSSCTGEATVKEFTQGRSDGQIVVTAENLGEASTNGGASPVLITDRVPSGLRAVAIEGVSGTNAADNVGPVECSLASLTCAFAGALPAYENIEVRISVVDEGAVSGEENEASVSGGGSATGTTVRQPIHVGGGEPFGVEDYGLVAEEVGGALDRQAGSHPFQLTTTLVFDQTRDALPAGAMAKDLHFRLPPGLVGNPTPLAQCTSKQFVTRASTSEGELYNECAPQTAIGMATVTVHSPIGGHITFRQPVFNLVPRPGEPARFGFVVLAVPVYLDTSVRTGEDYGVNVSVNNITQLTGFLSSRVTLWGVPGDPRHDSERGWACMNGWASCKALEALKPPPFLSLPTSCTGQLQTSVQADSWVQPGAFTEPFAPNEAMPGMGACNHLPFEPAVNVTPDVPDGSTPTGLTVGVHVSQAAVLNPTGIAESTLRDTTVALPEGVAVNAGGADGLEACSSEQIGFLPAESHGDELRFTAGFPSCPDGSKIATVEIETPLLPNALKGAAYLATPAPLGEEGKNPFNSLIAIYIVVQDPVSGTLVKLAGKVALDPGTGQLLATFKNTPQLPFENLRMHFFGGSRAPLGTPSLCGNFTTTAAFAPWSGNETVQAGSTFDILSGPNGGPCADPLPFAPSLTAGTTSIQAGGFTPFTMTMSRTDGNQNLQAVKLRMPPGLLGTLSSVKLCGEAEANAGTCGPESLIGHTIVSVGVGGNPFSVKGGEVFITGPYKGAPYGLSIVNPAKAGPFDLGKVIVRAKIEVDPITAVLTITTDTSGPYKIPTILDGIPLQIQHVNVTIDRPGFTFNPTNCSPLAITGSLTSDQGATKDLSVPFQITNCAVLAFKPKLTAKTNGKTSRAKGASLSVKLTYPAGPYDANIARVKVDLPKQLPSRLTTLQKACTAATFEANPANCPSASIVGHATATTPVMPVPLTGPAYFVSHGGEAFPSLIIVLQGYGATVHLVGTTFIDKAGITSSTFKTIPDVPVGTFELTLPQGKYSALAANGNLCTTKKLAMPTSFLAQNGAVIHTTTPIVPTGCAKKKAGHKHKHKSKK